MSAREYVAASALFSDSTLRDLCRVLPRNREQLAAVDGMGLFKANKYGEEILRIIKHYAPASAPKKEKKPGKHKTGDHQPAQAGGFQAYKDKVIAEGSTEAYQPWTEEEDRQIIREHHEGKSIQEISEIHRRTQGAIRSRLKKLEQI